MIQPAPAPYNAAASLGGRSLALELMRASKAATSKFNLLRALASLDPKRATWWLRGSGELVSQFMMESEAVTVVDELARAISRSRDLDTARLLAEFLSASPQYASQGAMCQLVDVLEPGEAAELLTPAFDRMVIQRTCGADVVIEGLL